MKTNFIINGKIQLVLVPSNDLEKELLKELCQQPVDMQMFTKLQVGLDSFADAIIVTTSAPKQEKKPEIIIEDEDVTFK